MKQKWENNGKNEFFGKIGKIYMIIYRTIGSDDNGNFEHWNYTVSDSNKNFGLKSINGFVRTEIGAKRKAMKIAFDWNYYGRICIRYF